MLARCAASSPPSVPACSPWASHRARRLRSRRPDRRKSRVALPPRGLAKYSRPIRRRLDRMPRSDSTSCVPGPVSTWASRRRRRSSSAPTWWRTSPKSPTPSTHRVMCRQGRSRSSSSCMACTRGALARDRWWIPLRSGAPKASVLSRTTGATATSLTCWPAKGASW